MKMSLDSIHHLSLKRLEVRIGEGYEVVLLSQSTRKPVCCVTHDSMILPRTGRRQVAIAAKGRGLDAEWPALRERLQSGRALRARLRPAPELLTPFSPERLLRFQPRLGKFLEFRPGEAQFHGSRIGGCLLGRTCARYGHNLPVVSLNHPGKGDLRGTGVVALTDLVQQIHKGLGGSESLRFKTFHVLSRAGLALNALITMNC